MPLQLLVHLVHLQQLVPLVHLRGVFKTIELFPVRELHHVPSPSNTANAVPQLVQREQLQELEQLVPLQ